MSGLSIAQGAALLRGHHTLALYDITKGSEGTTFETTRAATWVPFDAEAYSQFKYGLRSQADRFGALLATLLQSHFTDRLAEGEEIVVIGTPYKRVPNAAKLLAVSAERRMRSMGLPTSYTCIYQHRLAAGDYGTLPAQQRDQRNKQKKRYLDADDFAGKHVVVIDDIRITGSIERSIIALLQDVAVLSLTVINLVRLDPEVATREPQLEDRLNHCSVRDLRSLRRLMAQSEQFVLTTRAVKFILQASPRDVQELLHHLTPRQIAELYDAVIDEGYDLMERYQETFGVIFAYYPD